MHSLDDGGLVARLRRALPGMLRPLLHRTSWAFGTGAACVVLGLRAESALPRATAGSEAVASRTIGEDELKGLSAPCAAGTLPDGEFCVPFPEVRSEDEPPVGAAGAGLAGRSRFEAFDRIPRRPDRPASYRSYVYPVRGPVEAVSSRGSARGIDLPAPRGAEVEALRLEHQEGSAQVVFVGRLLGNTVVTRHAIREAGALREFVVLHGHLERAAPGLAIGQSVAEGALLGFVGDSGRQGLVQLHLEVRQVRPGVDIAKTEPQRLANDEITVDCDPRNVLPLRGGPAE